MSVLKRFEERELESGFRYKVPIYDSTSVIDLVEYTALDYFYKQPGQHALILGAQYGSGKTTLLLWFMGYHFYENREICVYRAKLSTFEFLNILDEAPIRLFIPYGGVFNYDHPDLEKAYFNFWEVGEVIDSLARDKINVVGTDMFVWGDDELLEPYRIKAVWWGKFLANLLIWKADKMRLKLGVYIDELSDLVPNRGEQLCAEHGKYGNQIMDAIDAYRRNRIRLVAVTHTLTELKRTFRNQFSAWFIKRTSTETVPSEYWNYDGVIKRLANWQVFVKDRTGNFNRRPSPVWVDTKNVGVKVEVTDELLDEYRRATISAGKGAMRWRERTLLLLRLMERMGVPMDYKKVGGILDLSKSYSHEILSQARELPEETLNRALSAVLEQ